jgi:hypothetical protein
VGVVRFAGPPVARTEAAPADPTRPTSVQDTASTQDTDSTRDTASTQDTDSTRDTASTQDTDSTRDTASTDSAREPGSVRLPQTRRHNCGSHRPRGETTTHGEHADGLSRAVVET